MHALRLAVGITWAAFWLGWLASAFTAKRSIGRGRGLGPRVVAAVAVGLLIRGTGTSGLEVHSIAIGAIGAGLFAAGLAIAIWARVILGRNWGMPTTQRLEPELITAGPYSLVRHPIYSGILLAVLGTALVTNLIALVVALVLCVYFVWAARVEERNMTVAFPTAYPPYRDQTRMLIPFIL